MFMMAVRPELRAFLGRSAILMRSWSVRGVVSALVLSSVLVVNNPPVSAQSIIWSKPCQAESTIPGRYILELSESNSSALIKARTEFLEAQSALIGYQLSSDKNNSRRFYIQGLSSLGKYILLKQLKLSGEDYLEQDAKFGSCDAHVPFNKLATSIPFSAYIPDDPFFVSQWGLLNVGQEVTELSPEVLDGFGTIGSDTAWAGIWPLIQDLPFTPTIAIISTGIAPYPAFEANIRTDGINIVDDTPNSTDNFGTGTRLASILASAVNDSSGIAGFAPTVKLLPINVFDSSGSTKASYVAQGLDYARSKHVDVILLGTHANSGYKAIKQAINRALKQDIVVVGFSGDYDPFSSPAHDLDSGKKDYPANYDFKSAYDSLIVAMGSDAHDYPLQLSNWGRKAVDLAAPGASILTLSHPPSGGPSDLQYEVHFSGLLAATLVSGTAALLRAQNPKISAMKIKKTILKSVDPVWTLSNKVFSGGRLNIANALFGSISAGGLSLPPPSKKWQTLSKSTASKKCFCSIDGVLQAKTNSCYKSQSGAFYANSATRNIEWSCPTAKFMRFQLKVDTEPVMDLVLFESGPPASTVVDVISGKQDKYLSTPIVGDVATLTLKSNFYLAKSGFKIKKIQVIW